MNKPTSRYKSVTRSVFGKDSPHYYWQYRSREAAVIDGTVYRVRQHIVRDRCCLAERYAHLVGNFPERCSREFGANAAFNADRRSIARGLMAKPPLCRSCQVMARVMAEGGLGYKAMRVTSEGVDLLGSRRRRRPEELGLDPGLD